MEEARYFLKKAEKIQGKVDSNECTWDDLRNHERNLLMDLSSNLLCDQLNDAVEAYGHGTLRVDGEELLIGASTGGRTRQVLDNWTVPNTQEFRGRKKAK